MADMKTLVPAGDFTIKTVGPSRNWEFNGNGGTVKMVTDSVQLEGHEQYWVDLNRAEDKPAPVAGDVIKGSIEQDAAGKYAPKFAKEKSSGGGWRGGGNAQASPGAIWATATQTAAHIVSGYYLASGKKPKDMSEYFSKIEAIAPKVNKLVEKFVGAAPKTDAAPATESGESAAPATPPAQAAAPKADATVEDISDEDLGDW